MTLVVAALSFFLPVLLGKCLPTPCECCNTKCACLHGAGGVAQICSGVCCPGALEPTMEPAWVTQDHHQPASAGGSLGLSGGLRLGGGGHSVAGVVAQALGLSSGTSEPPLPVGCDDPQCEVLLQVRERETLPFRALQLLFCQRLTLLPVVLQHDGETHCLSLRFRCHPTKD